MTELELKFQVPPARLPSLRQGLLDQGATRAKLSAQYHDTLDFRLAAHGLSLRLRREGRHWVQTLKAAGESTVARLEHEVPLGAVRGMPVLDPSRHDGTPAGDALRSALAPSDWRLLAPSHATEVTRLACTLALADGAIEVALDVGEVRAGDRTVPLCELELELKSGSAAALFALAGLWVRHGGLWLGSLSKSERGLLLASGLEHPAPVKAKVPALHRRMGGDALTRAVVRRVLDQVLANAAAVAAGSRHEDHVHQLRVGLRRLRTALRELAGLGATIDPAWEPALAAVFRRLGEVRDNETVAHTVAPLLLQAGASKLAWDVDTAPPDPGAVVREQEFQLALLGLLAFALHEAPDEPSHGEAVRRVKRRLSGLHRRVIEGGERFAELPAEGQHRVRKQLKRLRYLAEFVAAWWPQKQVERYLECLRPAQDALGLHNDVAVAAERFRRDAGRHPEALFSAGYLQARLLVTGREAQGALASLRRARRFWKR